MSDVGPTANALRDNRRIVWAVATFLDTGRGIGIKLIGRLDSPQAGMSDKRAGRYPRVGEEGSLHPAAAVRRAFFSSPRGPDGGGLRGNRQVRSVVR